MTDKFVYDEVPYSSFTFPQTRPDRLATLGAFHGLNTASPEKCRVLELGCGDGTNLISFAYLLPGSEFVGIDLSERHVAHGIDLAGQMGVTNLTLEKGDLMNFSRDQYGEFDYIIAHGLFSWVPQEVRTKVLKIYEECLVPEGVGYISYNAYPGCHIRQMFWNMMQFYTEKVENPMAKVEHGVNFLRFLAASTPADSLYQSIIKMELSQFADRTPENIFHDDFAGLNQPFYFHEFIDLITEHGLQFLSEVDSFWMEAGQLSPAVVKKLDELGDDIVHREQYIDFIKCRPFRSTLVCRSGNLLDRKPTAAILNDFFIASQVLPEAADPTLDDASAVTFVGPEGGKITVESPLTKAALICLEKAWSSCLTFDELIEQARQLIGPADDASVTETATDLLAMFHSGFVYLHRSRLPFAKAPGELPRSSEFVRWQLRNQAKDVTTLSGMNLKPDSDLMRLLLLLLDGTRDRGALTKEIAARIENNGVVKDRMMEDLAVAIDNKLLEFAKLGLLHE